MEVLEHKYKHMDKRCLVLIGIAFVLSLASITMSSYNRAVFIEAYQGQLKAQSSSTSGYADRWTATNHKDYAVGVQIQLNEIKEQIEILKERIQ